MERYSSILHKRHGWIFAPRGTYFAPSKTGKTIEFHEPTPMPREGWSFYPFGTTFHASSISAMEDYE